MSEKMPNAPIFYMVAQVKFNPVLAMKDSVEALQSSLRAKFPDFSHQVLNQIEFNVGLDSTGSNNLKQTQISRWHFKDLSGTTGLVLTTDSLFLQTTSYDTSEPFIEILLDGLKQVHQLVNLAYVEAVGFRSLDAIVPDEHRGLDFFIKPSLLGLYSSLEGELKHSVSELALIRGKVHLASRCILLNGNLGVPADLFPISLKISDKLSKINCIHSVLDNDAVYTDRFSFDVSEVHARLREVKSIISDAFYKAVTDNAISLWKFRPSD